jgi:hypothetical protein
MPEQATDAPLTQYPKRNICTKQRRTQKKPKWSRVLQIAVNYIKVFFIFQLKKWHCTPIRGSVPHARARHCTAKSGGPDNGK